MSQSTCFLRKYFASKTMFLSFFFENIKSVACAFETRKYCGMKIVAIAAIKQMLVTNQEIVWCQRYVHRDKAVD